MILLCRSSSFHDVHVLHTRQIDLGLANIPRVIEQVGNAFGFGEDEILKVLQVYHLIQCERFHLCVP